MYTHNMVLSSIRNVILESLLFMLPACPSINRHLLLLCCFPVRHLLREGRDTKFVVTVSMGIDRSEQAMVGGDYGLEVYGSWVGEFRWDS